MFPFEYLLAAVAMLVAVGLGTVAHELCHATVLAAAAVPYEMRWLHGTRGRLAAGASGTWASVRLERVPADLAPRTLRVAALSPLALAVPLVAIPVGAVPDPFAGGDLVVQFALVGWLACALPSPSDFSLCFQAERVIAERSRPVP